MAAEDDIGKIFEAYENMYVKNSEWVNHDDQRTTSVNDDETSTVSNTEEELPRELDIDTTEATADDVVETIHHIIDEKIDAKKNRTDRTIVVVVTTNVFGVNGSEDSNKRQHSHLSFGVPGMIHKESSTDATLEMHNKITTEFFNNNPPTVSEQFEAIDTKENEKSLADNVETIVDDGLDNSADTNPTTEDADLCDVTTTETPETEKLNDDLEPEYNFDIRHLHNSDDAPVEGRKLNEDLTNDILRIMKVIPNRSDDEGLSKPFEIPIPEPEDSSLMEAMENILDTDVRKAFERDIPQTRHVPLDINIEEETLYAPLKDLSEYIVEEVPVYDMMKDNLKSDGKIDEVKSDANGVESLGEIKDLPSGNQVETENEEKPTTAVPEEVPSTTETALIEEQKVEEPEKPLELDTTNLAEQEEQVASRTTNKFESNENNEQNEDAAGGEGNLRLSQTLLSRSAKIIKLLTHPPPLKEDLCTHECLE